MGYRHVPLARRLGPAFGADGHWRVAMPEAECFMYFIANMQRLFRTGGILVVEGRELDPGVKALYLARAVAAVPAALALRKPEGERFCVALGGGLTRALNELAARKTYAQVGERMYVFAQDGSLLMDGSRLGERLVRLSGGLPEAEVRRFAEGPLRGQVERVDSRT